MYRRIDKNNDKLVTYIEMRAYVQKMEGLAPSDKDSATIRNIFTVADKDGNDEVTLKEF